MQIGSERWRQVLIDGATGLKVHFSETQLEQFEQFARLLLVWNRKTNLTTITDPKEIAVKHLLDSIAALPHLTETDRLLDIGTGGGFPGLPLKIMRPGQPMTLIDGSRKKISFVRHAIQQLSLENIEAFQARAEDLAIRNGYAHGFDTVVSRAVADVKKLLGLALPLMSEKGTLVAYKGPRREMPVPEFSDVETQNRCVCTLQSGRFLFERIAFRLPASDNMRFLYIYKRLPENL